MEITGRIQKSATTIPGFLRALDFTDGCVGSAFGADSSLFLSWSLSHSVSHCLQLTILSEVPNERQKVVLN